MKRSIKFPLVVTIVLSVLVLAGFAIGARAAGCTPFLVASGGTGGCTWTSSQLLYGAGTGALKTVATTSVTAGTGVTFTSFTAIGSSPVTISASGGGTYPFTPGTFGSTNTSATTTALLDNAGFISTGSSTLQRLTMEFSTTTAATTTDFKTTNATIGSASGLVITTSGVVSTIAGTTCTNQFLRAFTSSGGTCAQVSSADVSLANLTATDSTLTFSGTYNGSTARTIGINLGNANTWTALQTINYASTTALTVSAGLYMPSLTSCPSVAGSGFASICLDTTSKQVQITNGSTIYPITATSSKAFNLASTTLDAMGKSFNTATSSFLLWNPPEAITLMGWYCTASTTGTAIVNFRHANGSITNSATCTTGGYTVATANTTWTQFEAFNVDASSTAGAVNRVTVTPVYQSTVQ